MVFWSSRVALGSPSRDKTITNQSSGALFLKIVLDINIDDAFLLTG
jgi:hypothetical protein